MMNYDSAPADVVKLQDAIQAVSRMNFYLWMYLAQEGEFEDAFEFVQEKQHTPTPFEALLGLNLWDNATACNSPAYDF
jgi:hypothetical protein